MDFKAARRGEDYIFLEALGIEDAPILETPHARHRHGRTIGHEDEDPLKSLRRLSRA